MITADTITDAEIRKLRKASADAEDWQTVSLCTVALNGRMSRSDRMWLLEPYRTPALKMHAQAVEARARCAEILNQRAGGGR